MSVMTTIFTHKYTDYSKDILNKTKCFIYEDYYNNPETDYIWFCFNKDWTFKKWDIKKIDEYWILKTIGKACLDDLINNTLNLNISDLNNLTLAFFMQYYYFSDNMNIDFNIFTKKIFSFVILDDVNKYNWNEKFKLYLEDSFI